MKLWPQWWAAVSVCVVLIIGNVLIIVLEGLIDFIQCLRLQFYELFSKYYTGDGEEFVPLSSEIRNTL
ncbi:MAG: hypothetical protein ACLS76_00590 [Eubacterium callanderi]